jgi:hypothetical protein
MRKKTLMIFAFAAVLISLLVCINPNQVFTKIILRFMGYYATPKYVTDSEILTKVHQENIYYDNLYRLENYTAYGDFIERKMISVPFVQIYDKHKKLLTLASGNECRWALMNFFSKEDSLALIAGDSQMYDYVMERLKPIDVKLSQDTFDYYVLAGWANYVPKLSAGLFTQTNKMKQTLHNKVRLNYINFDLQREWEAEKDSLERSR